MYIVFDLEEAVDIGVSLMDCLIPYVFATLNEIRVVFQVSLGVQVEVDDVIAENPKDVLAGLLADRIGGSEKSII